MRDEFGNEASTEEIIKTYSGETDEIIVQITDDSSITDDVKADLIQIFEEIGQFIDDALDLLRPSPES
jgi:hypothetical protein